MGRCGTPDGAGARAWEISSYTVPPLSTGRPRGRCARPGAAPTRSRKPRPPSPQPLGEGSGRQRSIGGLRSRSQPRGRWDVSDEMRRRLAIGVREASRSVERGGRRRSPSPDVPRFGRRDLVAESGFAEAREVAVDGVDARGGEGPPGVDMLAGSDYTPRLASLRDSCTLARRTARGVPAEPPKGGKEAGPRFGPSMQESKPRRAPRGCGGVPVRRSGPAPDGDRAHVAQPAEHFLGKEEVMGSSPIVSFAGPSRQPPGWDQ
jgi:hypothetical protein